MLLGKIIVLFKQDFSVQYNKTLPSSCTSLTPLVRCEIFCLLLYDSYVDLSYKPTSPLRCTIGWKNRPTMVSGRNGLYHQLYPGSAQTTHTNLIPTSWANVPALVLGVLHVLGITHYMVGTYKKR